MAAMHTLAQRHPGLAAGPSESEDFDSFLDAYSQEFPATGLVPLSPDRSLATGASLAGLSAVSAQALTDAWGHICHRPGAPATGACAKACDAVSRAVLDNYTTAGVVGTSIYNPSAVPSAATGQLDAPDSQGITVFLDLFVPAPFSSIPHFSILGPSPPGRSARSSTLIISGQGPASRLKYSAIHSLLAPRRTSASFHSISPDMIQNFLKGAGLEDLPARPRAEAPMVSSLLDVLGLNSGYFIRALYTQPELGGDLVALHIGVLQVPGAFSPVLPAGTGTGTGPDQTAPSPEQVVTYGGTILTERFLDPVFQRSFLLEFLGFNEAQIQGLVRLVRILRSLELTCFTIDQDDSCSIRLSPVPAPYDSSAQDPSVGLATLSSDIVAFLLGTSAGEDTAPSSPDSLGSSPKGGNDLRTQLTGQLLQAESRRTLLLSFLSACIRSLVLSRANGLWASGILDPSNGALLAPATGGSPGSPGNGAAYTTSLLVSLSGEHGLAWQPRVAHCVASNFSLRALFHPYPLSAADPNGGHPAVSTLAPEFTSPYGSLSPRTVQLFGILGLSATIVVEGLLSPPAEVLDHLDQTTTMASVLHVVDANPGREARRLDADFVCQQVGPLFGVGLLAALQAQNDQRQALGEALRNEVDQALLLRAARDRAAGRGQSLGHYQQVQQYHHQAQQQQSAAAGHLQQTSGPTGAGRRPNLSVQTTGPAVGPAGMRRPGTGGALTPLSPSVVTPSDMFFLSSQYASWLDSLPVLDTRQWLGGGQGTGVSTSKNFFLTHAEHAVNAYSGFYSDPNHTEYITAPGQAHGPMSLSISTKRSTSSSDAYMISTEVILRMGTRPVSHHEATFNLRPGMLSRICAGGFSASRIPVDKVLYELVKEVPDLQRVTPDAFIRCKRPEVVGKLLLESDRRQLNTTFKFGVLHARRGAPLNEVTLFNHLPLTGSQAATEQRMMSETNATKSRPTLFDPARLNGMQNSKTVPFLPVLFDMFLARIGRLVELKDWGKFRGGLDNKTDTTGTHSVFTQFDNLYDVMFHVCEMLPHKEGDTQQLERKRHIGNDIVVVVFCDTIGELMGLGYGEAEREQRPNATPTTARKSGASSIDNICLSHQIHVAVAVTPVSESLYLVRIIRKDGVSRFLPEAQKSNFVSSGLLEELSNKHPSAALFTPSGGETPFEPDRDNDWILMRSSDGNFEQAFIWLLIQAERAAFRAASFDAKLSRTRNAMLSNVIDSARAEMGL
ncbi:signal-induced proliferation-associated 1 [Fonticula alba]|uniref:Signal-induced proliferation-associated 1 n=1 Tax=Fonticula alba TaxID=691883 RepID=A0A058ZHA6_FONAL|nr:signal-induced proliferation-associated 1 [Fonticula alba]KCV73346.1 signal-induced proliferation-associated 1 [Fonticula alba]|eukprot:XP_009493047.1 signal-induced proliferation-associated 1 [Fonticula alba]